VAGITGGGILAAGQSNQSGERIIPIPPRTNRRDKYLFEEKIWIESQEFAIVRIAGHPAKNPSFWIKPISCVIDI